MATLRWSGSQFRNCESTFLAQGRHHQRVDRRRSEPPRRRARMLGADWGKPFVDVYVGGCDARRITLTESDLHLQHLQEASQSGVSPR